MHFDPKEAWRRLGAAKFTDSSQAFKAWCMEKHETYGIEAKEGVADSSFASDLHAVRGITTGSLLPELVDKNVD